MKSHINITTIKSPSVQAIGAMTLSMLFFGLDFYFRISPALIFDQLKNQYQVNALAMGALASVFYIGYIFAQIPAGLLLDRYRYHKVAIPAIILCVLSFIIFIMIKTFWVSYILRFLVGATSALSFIGVLYLAAHYFPINRFGLITGLAVSIGTISGSIIQLITAWLMKHYEWHMVFIGLASIGLIIAFTMFIKSFQVDKVKSVHKNKPIASKEIFKLMWQFSKNPSLLMNGIIGGLFYLPTTLLATMWGIPFMMNYYQFNNTQASWIITALFAGWAIGAPFAGILSDKFKNYMWFSSLSTICAALCSVAFIMVINKNLTFIWILMLIFGIFSSAQVIVWKQFRALCPKEITGYGTAFTNMVIMAAGAVFHLAVGWISEYHQYANYTKDEQIQLGLIIIPVALLIACLLSAVMAIKNTKSKTVNL